MTRPGVATSVNRRMRVRWATGALALLATVVGLFEVVGCSPPFDPVVPNLRPTVRLTAAPIDTTARTHYSVSLNWVGNDPDGRVTHFLYAIDPPSGAGSDTTWIKTEENEKTVVFSASRPAWQDPLTLARDFHVFVIKAVDQHGLASASVFRAFFAYTEAPIVNILTPKPSTLLTWKLPPVLRFTWTGRDDDGVFTNEPVRYKFKLLGPDSEFTPQQAEADPDGLRDFYAPAFAGWDSTPAETTEVVYSGLTPLARYLFAVVGFDEAGAYSPVFSLTNNMVRFVATFAGAAGPKIAVFNESFFHKAASGLYSTDPRLEVNIEVPAGRPVTFNWTAEPSLGALVKHYRWALDIADVSDDTPREDPVHDTHRWSQPSLNITSATVGPFNGGEEHRFYIEAEDNVGFKSLMVVRFFVVSLAVQRPLLIVDDTRFRGDQINAQTRCTIKPTGRWPTAAELDTFLFARGGRPWTCYPFDGSPAPPSPPGLFAGYPFDTIGTRYGAHDMSTRLGTLARYAHVIWLVDPDAAFHFLPGTNSAEPITSLRYMSGPGTATSRFFNTLSPYVQQGGKLWLAGAGAALASTLPWNDRDNDDGGTVFSNVTTRPELVPGRFMYDLATWRTEIRSRRSRAIPVQFTGRFGDSLGVLRPHANVHTRRPDYAALPARIAGKRPTTDGLARFAPTRRSSEFYQTQFYYEFIAKPNVVLEDVDPSPERVDMQSVLDTLYIATGSGLPTRTVNAHNVVMTYYHRPPPGSRDVVFSGFNLWNYNYEHLVELVDFVLQRLWGLPKTRS